MSIGNIVSTEYTITGKETDKSKQLHHYATNKNKSYTPQFKEIANKYGLDLEKAWNKDLLPHQGRHHNEYHDYILEQMKFLLLLQ